jgi:outer membrane protein OmpA-like peptidoglycan-associated protein
MRQRVILAAVLAAGSASAAPATRRDIDGVRAPDTDLLFRTDSSILAPDATKQLTHIVRWAERHPCGTVILDAHADPRGDEPHNLRLSAERATAVRDLLVSLGVNQDRIVIGLYGAQGPRRETLAADRRVTASVSTQPLYAIVDAREADGATALVWNKPVTLAELEGPPHPAAVATRCPTERLRARGGP